MQSDAINELAKALATAQTEIQNPTKTKEAKVGSYSYKYADIADVLSSVLPVLSKNGIAVSQPTVLDGEIMLVHTQLSHTSGQWMSSDYPVCRINGDHQKMGAALTYSRRYALCSMIGVAAEEDTDGQGASNAEAPKRKSAAKARKDGDWAEFENALNEPQSAAGVEIVAKHYRTNIYQTWNADWRREADELIEMRMAEFSAGEDFKQTLKDSITQTKAEYVHYCHETIASAGDVTSLRSWWQSGVETAARRRFSLTQPEVDDLKARVADKIKELGRPVSILEAG